MQRHYPRKETMNHTRVTPPDAGISDEDTQPLVTAEDEFETYHVYPLDEGIYIVKEGAQTPQDSQTIETTLVKKRPDSMFALLKREVAGKDTMWYQEEEYP